MASSAGGAQPPPPQPESAIALQYSDQRQGLPGGRFVSLPSESVAHGTGCDAPVARNDHSRAMGGYGDAHQQQAASAATIMQQQQQQQQQQHQLQQHKQRPPQLAWEQPPIFSPTPQHHNHHEAMGPLAYGSVAPPGTHTSLHPLQQPPTYYHAPHPQYTQGVAVSYPPPHPSGGYVWRSQYEYPPQPEQYGYQIAQQLPPHIYSARASTDFPGQLQRMPNEQWWSPKVFSARQVMTETVVKMHLAGCKNREIANQLGIHHNTVALRLKNAGYASRKTRPRPADVPEIAAVVDLFDNGVHPSNIAEQLDVSEAFVFQKLRTARRISGNDGDEKESVTHSGSARPTKKAKTSGASFTQDKADAIPDDAGILKQT